MVADRPVPPEVLGQLVEQSLEQVEELCSELALSYEAEDRGFQLQRVAGGYRFVTHPDLAPYVERFVLEGQSSRLSGAALETLAIVAYKQPVSRAQVSAIRGVDADGVLRTLVQRGFVEEVARDPGPGQAVLYGTTSDVPRAPRTRPRRPTCRRSASSSPTPMSSRPSNTASAWTQRQPAPGRYRGRRRRPLERRHRARAATPATTQPRRRSRRPATAAVTTVAAPDPDADGVRLQKVLARAGIGSRRVCEDLIADERVLVDGEVAVLGRRIDPARAKVTVDGVLVGVAEHLVHYLLHKPAGVITTADDPQGRPTVLDLVPAEPRVFPVGRLDQDTEGLLVVDQRRRPHPPPDPSVVRGRQGVPGRGRPPSQPGRAAATAGGHRTRGRPHRPGPGVDARRAHVAAGHPRGSQPAGPAHVRGGRRPGATPGADPDRPADATRRWRRGSGAR